MEIDDIISCINQKVIIKHQLEKEIQKQREEEYARKINEKQKLLAKIYESFIDLIPGEYNFGIGNTNYKIDRNNDDFTGAKSVRIYREYDGGENYVSINSLDIKIIKNIHSRIKKILIQIARKHGCVIQ
jgi:hypothetical protein